MMPATKTQTAPILRPSKTEDREQIKLVAWLRKNAILHYAVPNAGKRNLAHAVKMKRLGLTPGIPDLCIPLARKSCHGLYIELKRESGGKVSIAQEYWIHELNAQGYRAIVCKGADDAIRAIMDYLDCRY